MGFWAEKLLFLQFPCNLLPAIAENQRQFFENRRFAVCDSCQTDADEALAKMGFGDFNFFDVSQRNFNYLG
jgi:hypothetical protein